jgi:hypothetical protein
MKAEVFKMKSLCGIFSRKKQEEGVDKKRGGVIE